MRIAILGAGSIGCFVGGCWQAAGLDVAFVGRRRTADDIAEHGLTLTDHAGWKYEFARGGVRYSDDPAMLSDASVIVVAVKSNATTEAGQLIKTHGQPDTSVLSLQNGISNVEVLQRSLPEHQILAGMVGFNVAKAGPGHWHKGTSGDLICESAPATEEICNASAGSPAEVTTVGDMTPVAWGKLLLNLNNAINALSGLTLIEELSDRNFRRALAASIREAIRILRAADVRPAKIAPLPPGMLAPFIDTPDWFFRSVGLRLQKVDANARSSMADDFDAERPTEIDYLNGEIVNLAKQNGLDAPINAKIVELVKAAEAGGKRNLSGAELVEELGL